MSDIALPIGKKFRSQGRTLGEGDFTLLTNLTWTFDTIHSDAQWMKENSRFGERILAGPCVLSVAIGLARTSRIFDVFAENGLRIIALLGFEDVRFTAPVLPGDTLRVESEIVEARPSSKENQYVIKVMDTVYKQTGERCMSAVRAMLFEKVR